MSASNGVIAHRGSVIRTSLTAVTASFLMVSTLVMPRIALAEGDPADTTDLTTTTLESTADSGSPNLIDWIVSSLLSDDESGNPPDNGSGSSGG